MALPPQMVDMAMGAGGPATEVPEELMVELPEEGMLPEAQVRRGRGRPGGTRSLRHLEPATRRVGRAKASAPSGLGFWPPGTK